MDLREDFKEPPISFSKMEISHVSRNWLQGSVVNKKKFVGVCNSFLVSIVTVEMFVLLKNERIKFYMIILAKTLGTHTGEDLHDNILCVAWESFDNLWLVSFIHFHS